MCGHSHSHYHNFTFHWAYCTLYFAFIFFTFFHPSYIPSFLLLLYPWDSVSLCICDWLAIHFVDQAVPQIRDPPTSPLNTGFKGINHYARLLFIYLFIYRSFIFSIKLSMLIVVVVIKRRLLLLKCLHFITVCINFYRCKV